MGQDIANLSFISNKLSFHPIILFIACFKELVTRFKSSLDELLGGSIGLPTLTTILVKTGMKNLNLINLCELTIATGNNNF